MRRKFSERHQLTTVSELNVTPLLDLAFVLLIIFMITTPLIENSTDLVLPTGNAQGNPVNTDRVRAVSILADGSLTLDGKAATLDDVESTLAALVAKDPYTVVLIRAHKDSNMQKFTDVMETAKRAGVKRIGFGNTPKAE
jgi:biopolymer transport protein ExbD